MKTSYCRPILNCVTKDVQVNWSPPLLFTGTTKKSMEWALSKEMNPSCCCLHLTWVVGSTLQPLRAPFLTGAESGLSRGWENHEPDLAPSTSGLTQAACVKEADKECSFKELARTLVGVQGGPSWLTPRPQKELPRLEMGLRYGTQDWTTRSLSLEAPPQSESNRLPATFLGRVQFPKPIPTAPPQKGVASICRSPRQNHHNHH